MSGELKVVSKIQCDNDVDITVRDAETDYLRIYDEVRDYACTIADCEEAIGRKVIVDMGRTWEGYPIADMYRDGVIYRQIFATVDLNNGNHGRFNCEEI